MRVLSFRVFIVPLGAVCTLIAMGLQDAPARAERDGAIVSIRQQVKDCSQQDAADVCILSGESGPGAR